MLVVASHFAVLALSSRQGLTLKAALADLDADSARGNFNYINPQAQRRSIMRLELSEIETNMLQQVLEQYLSELRMEIADTDKMAFRDMLKERKELIIGVLDKIEVTESVDSGEKEVISSAA